jgi:L-2-hydroxyglutarate oxidase
VPQKCDVLIIGAGVVGISIGTALLESKPSLRVVIAEKEKSLGLHASGRNSGVLHSGFYYSPDSLKAKFCRDGNVALRKLAKKYQVPVREVGKVVVTRNFEEIAHLDALYQRGIANGVNIELLNESKLQEFEPLAVTFEKFLWSPTTAVSDSKLIIESLGKEFLSLGGKIDFEKKISLEKRANEVYDSTNSYLPTHIVNAAGAQADRISRSIGIGSEYAMVPFMGIYRATEEVNLPLKRLVYPVPHPINPFLGVHFTLTIDHKVKIGPTAIPISGREQYSPLSGWSGPDISQAIKGIAAIIRKDAHDLSAILKSEWPKIIQSRLVEESRSLVPSAGTIKNWSKRPPGIRAQLVHLPSGKLEQDFIVHSEHNTIHVLNAVSPGWTSALPFGRFIANKILTRI